MKFIASLLIFSVVNIDATSFRAALQEKFMSEALGVSNCQAQCDNILAGIATAGQQACTDGCNYCLDGEKYLVPDNTCFTYCKTTDWSAQGICKDTIEPDKSCMLGCMISLCQGEDFCIGCDVNGGAKCCWAQSFQYNGNSYPGCESPTKTFPSSVACSTCTPDCVTYPTEAQCN